ncbi:MAG: hypothetical protein LBS16_06155 [Prevotellaceae bacterium]|jgi:hypothetical protein|nr:hypothetical protein [Prevotellaceae bacterium]
MFKDKKTRLLLFYAGYALAIVGALLYGGEWFHLFRLGWYYSILVYAVGAVLCSFFRLLLLPQSADRRIRRLNNQQFFSVLCQLGTIYLMWTAHDAWIAPLLLCALIDLWLSFRYPRVNNMNNV